VTPLDASDVDANGNLWLRLEVDEANAGGGARAQWKINDLAVGLDALAPGEAKSGETK
jgi:hypothetical protein